jgi:hypothetical protein
MHFLINDIIAVIAINLASEAFRISLLAPVHVFIWRAYNLPSST